MRLSNRELYIVYFLGFLLGCGMLGVILSRREAPAHADLSEAERDIAKLVQFLDLRREPLEPDEVISWKELPADASGFPRIQALLESQLHGESLLVEQWLDEGVQGLFVRKTRVWRADQLWVRLPADQVGDPAAVEIWGTPALLELHGLKSLEWLDGEEGAWLLATLQEPGGEALDAVAERLTALEGSFICALRVPVDGKGGVISGLTGPVASAASTWWRWYVHP